MASEVKFEKVDFYYGAFKAIDSLQLTILARKVSAFIGPSGCGKSTVLRMVNRTNELVAERTRLEGRVLIADENIYDGVDLFSLRKKVGMVFQRPNPFPKTVYENIAWAPRIHGVKRTDELDEIVEKSLKRAALWDQVKNKLKSSALSLSGGQQQRLCIARSIAVNPEVLLMDEPTSALDPRATARIEDLVEELKADYTIVIVTHSMQQAARISDSTAFFLSEGAGRPGRLIEFGETERVFTNPSSRLTEKYITGRFG
ncbi:MAG: phosphate ABC transporter ATP-binding protein PstB [Actinobacteria bacterium]|nr:phosphate ABC transporter ATP-binding protein PstB [Actinomycetota bacterium]